MIKTKLDVKELTTYKTDFICTYNYIDDLEDSQMLYQIQLLQAFDLFEYKYDIINNITEELYELYKDNKYILGILLINNYNLEDNLSKFRFNFRYDTFYLFHSLLCSLINNTEPNKQLCNKLEQKISSSLPI